MVQYRTSRVKLSHNYGVCCACQGRGGPPEDVTAYTWNRALSEDPEPRVPQTVTEYGYSRDGQAVFVSSSKRGLRQNGFKVSNTTFDFTDGVMVSR